jgi:hypothetical protein
LLTLRIEPTALAKTSDEAPHPNDRTFVIHAYWFHKYPYTNLTADVRRPLRTHDDQFPRSGVSGKSGIRSGSDIGLSRIDSARFDLGIEKFHEAFDVWSLNDRRDWH